MPGTDTPIRPLRWPPCRGLPYPPSPLLLLLALGAFTCLSHGTIERGGEVHVMGHGPSYLMSDQLLYGAVEPRPVSPHPASSCLPACYNLTGDNSNDDCYI